MAEDEDYGVGRIRIVLDDSEAVADAGDLGARISRALDRNTRDIGRQIRRSVQRGLNSASVSVRVVPDLRRFDAALLSGLRSTGGLNIPVAPDLTGFNERVRALLAGEEFPVRVVPDLDDFNDRIRRRNAPDVTVNVDVDSDRLTRALSGLATSQVALPGRWAGYCGSARSASRPPARRSPSPVCSPHSPRRPGSWPRSRRSSASSSRPTRSVWRSSVSRTRSPPPLTGTGEEFQESLENLAPAALTVTPEGQHAWYGTPDGPSWPCPDSL